MKPTHEERFSDNDEFNTCLMHFRGYEKKKIYAWVASNGSLLSEGSSSLQLLLFRKEEMENYAKLNNITVRLIEFSRNRTCCKVSPPRDDDTYGTCGGSAIGGRIISSIDHVFDEIQRIFSKHYPSKDVVFRKEENSVYAEHKNVRCWITKMSDLEIDAETGFEKTWSAYITMIKNWNYEYHDVHIGDFVHGCQAIEEAFIAFTRYQIAEQTIDDFF